MTNTCWDYFSIHYNFLLSPCSPEGSEAAVSKLSLVVRSGMQSAYCPVESSPLTRRTTRVVAYQRNSFQVQRGKDEEGFGRSMVQSFLLVVLFSLLNKSNSFLPPGYRHFFDACL